MGPKRTSGRSTKTSAFTPRTDIVSQTTPEKCRKREVKLERQLRGELISITAKLARNSSPALAPARLRADEPLGRELFIADQTNVVLVSRRTVAGVSQIRL
jgi:hypothetical protein